MSSLPVRWRLFALCFTILASLASASADAVIISSDGVSNPGNSAMSFTRDYTAPYSGGPFQLAEVFYTDVLQRDLGQSGTSTVTGNLPGGYIMEALVDGNVVASMGTGCSATSSTPCSSPPPFFIATNYNSLPSGTLELKFAFTLSDHSNFSWQAEEDLTPVPEPGSLMLLGSGVLGLAGFLRRKL